MIAIDNFTNKLAFTDVSMKNDIIDESIKYECNSKNDYFSLIISINKLISSYERNNSNEKLNVVQIKNNILKRIKCIMKKYSTEYIYTFKNNCFYIMVGINKNLIEEEFIDKIAGSISEAIRKEINGVDFIIGIGGRACNLKEFKNSIMEAESAIKIAKKIKMKNNIISYKNIEVYSLFLEIENFDVMINLYNETLGKLIEYERNKNNELLNSLETYIDENRNIGNAAEKLFIHRNTMKYRIKKIEKILGCDLKNDKTIFNITLCLKIAKFLGEN